MMEVNLEELDCEPKRTNGTAANCLQGLGDTYSWMHVIQRDRKYVVIGLSGFVGEPSARRCRE